MKNKVEQGYEQTHDEAEIQRWLAHWDRLGCSIRPYSDRRTMIQKLVSSGHDVINRPVVKEIIRRLGGQATEHIQLAYVEAGRPAIKN